MTDICCVIPALNEAGTVSRVIEGSKRFVRDVVVVDDGSNDCTGDRAREAGAIVLRHERPGGKGMALRTGFAYVMENGYDAAVTLDADGQHDPSEIGKFIESYAAGEGDIIIGTRLWNRDAIPRYRYIPNRIGVFCVSKAAGCRIDDSQSGFRLYGREVLNGLTLNSTGFEMETEILIKAGRKGFSIHGLPIRVIYNADQRTYFRPVRDFYRISILVLRLSILGD